MKVTELEVIPNRRGPNPTLGVRAPMRKQLLLADGWHIKQLDTEQPDVGQLSRQATAPDERTRRLIAGPRASAFATSSRSSPSQRPVRSDSNS